MRLTGLWQYFLFALIVLAAGPVSASVCSNPATMDEGDIIYNYYYHVPQFCNGTTWVNAGSVAAPESMVAPPPLGETNIEPNTDSGDANEIIADEVTLLAPGVVQSLSIYIAATGGQVILGIYDATGPSGGPGSLLATTAAFTPTSGWNTANLVTPVTLAAGTYWLAFLPNSGSLGPVYASDASGVTENYYYNYTYGALPSTFSTSPNPQTAVYSFYANLTAVNSACTSPAGNEGNIIYNGGTYHTYQFCNGTSWQAMELVVSGGGGGGCSNPSGHESDIIYNGDHHTLQFCNGTNWVAFGGPAWQSVPTSSDGYIVMSETTWNGNLGQQAGANAKCLTDLTTNTGWKGYTDANARGLLVSGHVAALMCADLACNGLAANTTYYFADANNSTHGGNRFTTDGNREGPYDSEEWSQASYFGAIYGYWTNITGGNGNFCSSGGAASGSPADCSASTAFDNGTNSYTGEIGYSAQNYNYLWPGSRCGATYVTCDNAEHLVCIVNP
jgi:hypothetical protein